MSGLRSNLGFLLRVLAGVIGFTAAGGVARAKDKVQVPVAPSGPVIKYVHYPRPAETWLEAQVELARRGFSSGPIDGVPGEQSAAALRAFQESQGLNVTGYLDDDTRTALMLASAPFVPRPVKAEDLAKLQPLSSTWLGKSQQTELGYETALEMLSEKYHAHPMLLKKLNPDVDWGNVKADTVVTVPNVDQVTIDQTLVRLRIRLAEHTLDGFGPDGSIIVHFPVSIARMVEKRPVGELHVVVVIADPDYTLDPEVFPESEEAQQIGHKLRVPPGPNNPVGVAWIGLDRTGYGIHGTPSPEKVGRTESHGCFRLANWDAYTLRDAAWVGMPVVVEP